MAFSTLTAVLTPIGVFALVALGYGVYRVVMQIVALLTAVVDLLHAVVFFFFTQVRRRIPGITKATLVFYCKLFHILPLMTAESARICAVSCNTLTGLFLLFHAALAIRNDVVLAAGVALGVHNTWWSWDQEGILPFAAVFFVATVAVRDILGSLLCMTFFSLVVFVVILAEKYRTIGYH